MQLTAIGLNHQTAPISIREKLAFAAQILPTAVKSIITDEAAKEAVILSTCNRTEIYCIGQPNEIVDWIADYHHLPAHDIRPFLYTLTQDQTIRHAFRVSCGLDSMVLGEPQILGQLKNAVRISQEQNAIHGQLNALFQRTFSVAKEVRSTTAVGQSSVSMAAASVKMVEQIFPAIEDLNVLFVGAGEMIELVATYFAAKTPKQMTVANRTIERAHELTRTIGQNANAILLNDLPQLMQEYDVVVSSTASPLPIIGKGLIEKSLKNRKNKPIFLLDLAVPRDIESEVSELDDAFLYTVDDISSIVQMGQDARKQAAAEAENIIDTRVTEFLQWQKSREAVPLIRALRDDGEQARQYVLNNALKQLAKGTPAEDVLHRLSVQLTNKLLHAPTRSLSDASGVDNEIIDTLTKVYHLPRE